MTILQRCAILPRNSKNGTVRRRVITSPTVITRNSLPKVNGSHNETGRCTSTRLDPGAPRRPTAKDVINVRHRKGGRHLRRPPPRGRPLKPAKIMPELVMNVGPRPEVVRHLTIRAWGYSSYRQR